MRLVIVPKTSPKIYNASLGHRLVRAAVRSSLMVSVAVSFRQKLLFARFESIKIPSRPNTNDSDSAASKS